MSPDQKAGRLNVIAEEIDATRRLVQAAVMACAGLDENQRDPLDELLATVGERLRTIAAGVMEHDA